MTYVPRKRIIPEGGTTGQVLRKASGENWQLEWGDAAGGIAGPQGATGAQGEAGPVGPQGPQGPIGLTGPAGATGATGPAGPQGVAGAKGDTGPQGLTGNTGPQGVQGPAGANGAQGLTGPRIGTDAFGYGAGAGGTVTQATNKSTAVTLNKLTGDITMASAALAAGAVATFILNNSSVAMGDMIVTSHHSGGTIGPYLINARVTGAGVASIAVRNTGAASLAEAIVIKFAVIKTATT